MFLNSSQGSPIFYWCKNSYTQDVVPVAATVLAKVLELSVCCMASKGYSSKPLSFVLGGDALVSEFSFLIEENSDFRLLEADLQTLPLLHVFVEEVALNRKVMEAITYLHQYSQYEFRRTLLCAWFVVCLGRFAGQTSSSQYDLFCAALLQDVGKVFDQGNLNDWLKSERSKSACNSDLTPDAHPLVSSTFVEHVFPDRPVVAQLVLRHHAQPDGDGYPAGVGMAQTSFDEQLLIVTNSLVEPLVDSFNGKTLPACAELLRVNALVGYTRANYTAYTMLKETLGTALSSHRLDESKPASRELELVTRVARLREFVASCLLLSRAMISSEYDERVLRLRAAIERLVYACNETGLLNDALLHEYETISAAEVSEALQVLEHFASLVKNIESKIAAVRLLPCSSLASKELKNTLDSGSHYLNLLESACVSVFR